MKYFNLFFLCSILYPFHAMADDNLKAFPEAEKGTTRHVLSLPAKEDESLFRVEILVGKPVEVDSVNQHFFAGEIEEVNIEGWGFSRYVVETFGPMAGTRLEPPPGTPKVRKFVTLGGDAFLVRYNSKLPVVVYVPDGCEVRFRIWSTTAKSVAIDQG